MQCWVFATDPWVSGAAVCLVHGLPIPYISGGTALHKTLVLEVLAQTYMGPVSFLFPLTFWLTQCRCSSVEFLSHKIKGVLIIVFVLLVLGWQDTIVTFLLRMDWTVPGITKASGQTMTWSTSARLWGGYSQRRSRRHHMAAASLGYWKRCEFQHLLTINKSRLSEWNYFSKVIYELMWDNQITKDLSVCLLGILDK